MFQVGGPVNSSSLLQLPFVSPLIVTLMLRPRSPGLSGMARLAFPIGLLALLTSYLVPTVRAQGPVQLPWGDCFTGTNLTQKLNVTTVYAQLVDQTSLNITILGQSNIPIRGQVNDSTKLGAFEYGVHQFWRMLTKGSSYAIHLIRNSYLQCMDV